MIDDPYVIVARVAEVLDRAGIEYALGGSAARSLLGEPRTTNDVDFALLVAESRVEAAFAPLTADFFVDLEAVRTAARRHASFNIFHRDTMLEVDFFVLAGDPFDREQMRRRKYVTVIEGASQQVATTTAEDLVLRKLAWFRAGGGVSDRQWRDVLGILKTQKPNLDVAHPRRWAPHVDVAALLEEALAESGIG